MNRIGATLVAFALALPPRGVGAQTTAGPDWQTDSVRSTVLGETRRVHVALPITHGAKAWSGDRYPVLIILDGSPSATLTAKLANIRVFSQLDAQMIPELIVVAVETSKNRYRDMTLPLLPGQKTDRRDIGGAPAFAAFLTEELLPWVASRYPAAPFTIVQGHSMSGLFAAYLYGHSPTKISAVIALSPSLMLNDGRDYDVVLQGIRSRTTPGFFFVAASNGESKTIPRLVRKFENDMTRASSSSTVFLSHMFDGYNHGYVSLLGAIEGLQSIFRPLSLMGQTEGFMTSSDEFLAQYAAVRKRYIAAAPTYNLPARLPLMFTFNWADYMAESEPTLRAAVPTLCAELRNSYPSHWHGYACNGQLKLAQRDLPAAEASFKEALSAAERAGDQQGIPFARAGLQRVERAKKP